MRDDDELHPAERDLAEELTALRETLQQQRKALETERRNAQHWEREAVLRASTVAGALTTSVVAARRLAATVERNLTKLTADTNALALQEVRDALEFFREVAKDPAQR